MAFGLDDAVAAGLKIIDKFVPDPAAKAQAEKDLRDSLLNWDGSQNTVNAAEASSADPFSSRARPAILWVFAISLLWNVVLVPVAMYLGFWFGHPIPKPPTLLDDHMWEMMFGMLGLGGMRTYEKLKGVA